jgi:ectoine hydroxylase-related dioxygenase (phytanoyl-CoA dioxygenase family)
MRELDESGYVLLPGVVDRQQLTELVAKLREAYSRSSREGLPFVGGGTKSGHLNCFPGAESRFVYEALEQGGIFDLVRRASVAPLRKPNIGCNFNLPGSHEQNDHVDGDPARPFWIVNVAAVDTTLENGAMEVLHETHRSKHEYWRLLLERPERRRVPMRQGDALIRVSTLWHRGMPNRTATPRPMLAFTWEDGGSVDDDPYAVHDGRMTFLPNRYGSDWKSRLREHAFALSPSLGTAFLALRSLVRPAANARDIRRDFPST